MVDGLAAHFDARDEPHRKGRREFKVLGFAGRELDRVMREREVGEQLAWRGRVQYLMREAEQVLVALDRVVAQEGVEVGPAEAEIRQQRLIVQCIDRIQAAQAEVARR